MSPEKPAIAAALSAILLHAAPALAQPAATAPGEALLCGEPAPAFEFGFQAEQRFATGNMPIDIAAADFDGAGPVDLLTADAGAATVSALLNDGAGGLAPPVTSGTGATPAAIAVADLDGDGLSDTAGANRNAGSVVVLLNDGAGGLELSATLTGLPVLPAAVAAADLDDDGDVDLAVAGPSVPAALLPLPPNVASDGDATRGPAVVFSPDPVQFEAVPVGDTAIRAVTMSNPNSNTTIEVLMPFSSPDPDFSVPVENCAGMVLAPGASCNFAVAWTPASAGIDASTVGTDIAGPGVGIPVSVDVIGQAIQPAVNVVTLLNQGGGQFIIGESFGSVTQPGAISAADHDGNGRVDLAVAAAGADTVVVFNNLADGFSGDRFETVALSGITPGALAAADFDCDGDVDLGVANLDSDDVSILINTADGGLGEAQLLETIPNPSSLAAGDFDGDGVPDLAVSTFGEVNEAGDDIADAVTLLSNDGTGVFAVGSTFGVGAGPAGITAGDLNGDSLTDLATANSVGDDVSVLLTDIRMTTLSIAGMQLMGSIGGDSLFTQFDIANTGDFPAAQLVFVSELPPGLSLVAGYNRAPSCSISAPADNQRELRCVAEEIPDWQCDADGQLLVCELGQLPPGAQAPLVVHGRTPGGMFTLGAEVAAGNAELRSATAELSR